jgi:hypothetical protein
MQNSVPVERYKQSSHPFWQAIKEISNHKLIDKSLFSKHHALIVVYNNSVIQVCLQGLDEDLALYHVALVDKVLKAT